MKPVVCKNLELLVTLYNKEIKEKRGKGRTKETPKAIIRFLATWTKHTLSNAAICCLHRMAMQLWL